VCEHLDSLRVWPGAVFGAPVIGIFGQAPTDLKLSDPSKPGAELPPTDRGSAIAIRLGLFRGIIARGY
jgi:hypothetical protein